jgi:hypothetical protein
MHHAGVEVEVLRDDALGYSSDLLVLKYAQQPYGADRAAIRVMGIDESELPAIGGRLLVPDPPGLSPRNLLFLGVEPISTFSYRSIRTFARRALSMAMDISPPVRELSMTMHGVGFGLDEIEAFASQIEGIVDALDAGRYPDSLQAVRIIERNPGRVDRMRQVLFSLLNPGPTENILAFPHQASTRRLAHQTVTASRDPATQPRAFVAMPFADSFEDVFHFGIAPQVRGAGLLCERIDQVTFTGDVVNLMRERIASSAVVVADLSEANPNVYLEVGYAWGVGVPCVLICNKKTDLKFDLQGHRCLIYGTIKELEKKLSDELTALSRQLGPWRSPHPAR